MSYTPREGLSGRRSGATPSSAGPGVPARPRALRPSPPTEAEGDGGGQENGDYPQAGRPPPPIRPACGPGDHGRLEAGTVVDHPDRVPGRQVGQVRDQPEVGGHPADRVPPEVGPDVAPGPSR